MVRGGEGERARCCRIACVLDELATIAAANRLLEGRKCPRCRLASPSA